MIEKHIDLLCTDTAEPSLPLRKMGGTSDQYAVGDWPVMWPEMWHI